MADEVRSKVTIRKKGQITIKKEILDAIHADIGDEIDFKVIDGVLIGTPVVSVPKEDMEIYKLYRQRLAEVDNSDTWETISIDNEAEFIKMARKNAGLD
ncbi:AbrB/MazE/SpoVT family DNA-binding domain-containing protein [Paenibacillus qinlingensis]|uniref:Antitoxin component of MazEF toxin-antitoxin module n=1 Tax=Paenibacillus qinlingensis TaxID=1837343 RepID=A0ABU1NWZ8_9BACL|nr:AbrB/MazE/SpoVT family DNA-binding domain-containing protein [Paenibacillus qinlingensis]MDR6552014.1 antitoxin component of MazEF toxin-antitoxin module [Paenibacillus qinlingensis]